MKEPYVSCVIWIQNRKSGGFHQIIEIEKVKFNTAFSELFPLFTRDECKLFMFHRDVYEATQFRDDGHEAYKSDSIHWSCYQSPDSTCSYNVRLDPTMDNCVYCGQPLERK